MLVRSNLRTSPLGSLPLLGAILIAAASCTKKEPEPAVEEAPVESTSPLGLDLWAGVPPLEAEPGELEGELAPRPGPEKPPSVGETIEAPFPSEGPAPSGVPTPTVTDLAVERFGPTGEQTLVDAIRVTFNQPMVPLADVEALRSETVPLEIDPKPPGKVRWLGTKTVAFYPDGRLPFSTTYRVTVPAGVESVAGKKLAKEQAWTISTPRLALEWSTPWDGDTGVELEPTLVLTFNQPIQKTGVLAALSLRGGGGKVAFSEVEPPLGTIAADAESWQNARVLAIKPAAPLRPNTRYQLELPAGVYGEGTDPSERIRLGFNTYPPLTLTKAPCYGKCWAGDGITLQATNAITDPKIEEKVHVEPAVENLVVENWGSQIHLTGKFIGDSGYTVSVDPGVTDVHGQKLAKPFKTRVRLGPYYPSLSLSQAGHDPAVIERSSTPELLLKVAGLDKLELNARKLAVDEVPSFFDVYSYDGEWGWPTASAAPTFTKSFDVRKSRKLPEDFALDLSSVLGERNVGWLIARSNPFTVDGWKSRVGLTQMVEVTDLGIATALDVDSGVALVTRLSDGKPVEGATVKLLQTQPAHELWSGTTDSAGMVELSYSANHNRMIVVAEHGGDAAFMRVDQADLRGRWAYWAAGENAPRGFMFTDRAPYKPGDTIHLVGILRMETRGPEGAVEMWRQDTTGKYKVVDPRGLDVAEGEVKIGPFGTFTVDIPTKEDGGTGNYNFTLTMPSLFGPEQTFWHGIPVESYRAPEFEVEVARAESKALVFGDTLRAEIRGRYLHGAPLVGGEVQYTLSRSETDFRPPGSENEAFTFGQGSAWWGGGWGRHHFGGWGGPSYGGGMVKSGDGSLDDKGILGVEHALAQVEPPPPGAPPPVVDPTKKPEETPPRAATFTLQASVTDQNRQAIAGSASFVVHPALVYVGVRSDKSVLNEGERASVEAVAVDLEGKRLEGRELLVEVVRRETTRKAVEKGGVWTFEYETKEEPVESCRLTSAAAPAECAVTVGKPGTYLVRGSAKDEAGRTNRSESTLYVHGKDEVVWEQTDRRVDLVPDKREYQPGDTATVLLRSPFTEARGVVVIEREGIARKMSVAVAGGAHTVEIPIGEHMIGGVTLSAVLVRGRVDVPGAPPGQDLGMPAVAVGEVDLDVTTDAKKIFVELEPSAREIAPKDTLELTIRTKDSAGEARKAAVAVMVVDEGVLSLMDYKTPDPLAAFHYKRSGNVWLHALHARVLPRNPPDPTRAVLGADGEFGAGGLGLRGFGPGGGGAGEGTIGLGTVGTIGHGSGTGSGYGRGAGGGLYKDADDAMPRAAAAPMEEKSEAQRDRGPMKKAKAPSSRAPSAPLLDPAQAMAQEVSLRTMFATTAYFDAEILVDESGETTVSIPMPENLTTFRIMAVAVDTEAPDRFGSADSSVRVRKPIMIRPSLPRFANFGDEFEASIMVDNQTGEAQAVLVGTRGLNVVLPAETQKVVEIPAGESREVRFDMAVEQVGKMKLQFAAMSNDGRDATEITLPVHWPATTQAFADYGMTDGSVLQKIEPPKDALPGYGGLELGFSSTAMSGLEDAVEYLVTYPYECAEQTASRIVPIFALGKILDDFPIAETHDKTRRDELGKEGIARLLRHQLHDGGFGYWRNDESWPYLTNWVTFALLEGKKQGFTVEAAALDNALRYVERFVRHGYRSRWGDYYDWTSRAFGLWLLSGEGKAAELFDVVWAHRDELPLYARAQLMAAAHRYGRTKERDEIREQIKQAVVETARTVHFAESKSEAASDGLRVLMHSDVQTDSIVLMALLEVDAADTMLPKVMAGIMSDRDPKRGGRWGTTHANAWALVSASRYYAAVEKDEPDFTARVWLDSQFAGEHAFSGRSMTKVNQRIPMASLVGAESRELVLGKDGAGKLYYRMGLRYAPADLKMKAEDQGFAIRREYEALPDKDGKVDAEAVKQLEDGSWQIKAGAQVKVTIHVVASDRANYVVVDDPLPAGFEGENPRFVTSVGALASGTIDYGRGRRPHRRSYGYHSYVGDGWWWPWFSFSHTEMRDDRVLLFADHLPAGVYTYSYTARATSIGKFQLPPVKAEAMYEPERFGHGSSTMVTVVE